MEIPMYITLLNQDKNNILVKENTYSYDGWEPVKSVTPVDIVNIANAVFHLSERAEEHCLLVALDNQCVPMGVFELSHGSVNEAHVRAREIFIRLLLVGASAFIVLHNHPSGDSTPSSEDIATTNKLVQAAQLMDIPMKDHIVVGNISHYSMREKHTVEFN